MLTSVIYVRRMEEEDSLNSSNMLLQDTVNLYANEEKTWSTASPIALAPTARETLDIVVY